MAKRSAVVVVGLGYGDEGKGAVVDHLTRELEAHTVVRFSGGAQAAHNVVAPDGRHHTFAQFGSGTFAGARTHLAAGMMINPLNMFNEYFHLVSLGEGDVWETLTVHPDCLITTPLHIAANRIRENRRSGNIHGTTGQGIGETVRTAMVLDPLRAGDLTHPKRVREKIQAVADYYRATFRLGELDEERMNEDEQLLAGLRQEIVEATLDRYQDWIERTALTPGDHLSLRRGSVIFEGAQGVLLDESLGFHPHTTWARTTAGDARRELAAAGYKPEQVRVVGVTRSYSTRHGAGPFVSGERTYLKVEDLWNKFEEPHNTGGTAGGFRAGPFDAVAFLYAVRCNGGVGEVAITHTERVEDEWPYVSRYAYCGSDEPAPYLLLEDGYVCGIESGDTAHMECVTRRLFDCQPRVEVIQRDEVLALIGRIADAPVTIVGRGPNNYETVAV